MGLREEGAAGLDFYIPREEGVNPGLFLNLGEEEAGESDSRVLKEERI